MAETRMPNSAEASHFTEHVLKTATEWLDSHPHIDSRYFEVEVDVAHIDNARENLEDYISKRTFIEPKGQVMADA